MRLSSLKEPGTIGFHNKRARERTSNQGFLEHSKGPALAAPNNDLILEIMTAVPSLEGLSSRDGFLSFPLSLSIAEIGKLFWTKARKIAPPAPQVARNVGKLRKPSADIYAKMSVNQNFQRINFG